MEPSLFQFQEDGSVTYDSDPDEEYGNDRVRETIHPQTVEFRGQSYQVYDVGLGLCWYWTEDPAAELVGAEYKACKEAVSPPGIDVQETLNFRRDGS